jgi:hypothetical protein
MGDGGRESNDEQSDDRERAGNDPHARSGINGVAVFVKSRTIGSA